MHVDPLDAAGAVVRTVERRERDGQPVSAIIAERSYATDIADLWDALTSAERIPRWFLPVSGDLRVGGRYQLEGNAGGLITACDPPSAFSVTWEYGDQLSWVTVELSADGAQRTRLRLEHIAPTDDHWSEFGPGAVGVGWDMALLDLHLHLASGTQVDPVAFEAWVGSSEGHSFIHRCSDGWGRAHVAAGAEAEAALAAAARTEAAYTAS